MLKKKLFILLQNIVPQHFLSFLMGKAANSQCKLLKNFMISHFIKRYQVDMSIAQFENVADYPSFNAFFTRSLKSHVRPIAAGDNTVTSPVDGCISQIGKIQDQTLIQAKKAYYSVDTLLGGFRDIAEKFTEGNFATLYLAPKDYHRVHIPLNAKLTETIYIPGRLFSVNATATELIPQLFTRNERLVCLFDTAAGPMAVILIGAMLVGRIQTIWGLVEKSHEIVRRKYNEQDVVDLLKGAELGRFNMGSSVILLFPKNKIQWAANLDGACKVMMGEAIGSLLP
jgi:phosphatidylserine decarboxylase